MCSAQRHALFDISTSKSAPNAQCFLAFPLANVLRATTACTFSTSQLPKAVRTWGAFSFFTCTCALRHSGVHFLDISTSKSAPDVFCTFWLANVLRATTACNFSSLIWPDGSASAALASLLFDPLEPQIIGKTQCFASFLPFRAPAFSFCWLFLFSDLLSSALLFSVLLLHLCFSSVHIVGSLTSKLPSMNNQSFVISVFCLRFAASEVQVQIPTSLFRSGNGWPSNWLHQSSSLHRLILPSYPQHQRTGKESSADVFSHIPMWSLFGTSWLSQFGLWDPHWPEFVASLGPRDFSTTQWLREDPNHV